MQHRKTRHTGLVAAPSAALIGAALSIGFVPGASADEVSEQTSVEASADASASAADRADVAADASEDRAQARGEYGAQVSAQARADQDHDSEDDEQNDDEDVVVDGEVEDGDDSEGELEVVAGGSGAAGAGVAGSQGAAFRAGTAAVPTSVAAGTTSVLPQTGVDEHYMTLLATGGLLLAGGAGLLVHRRRLGAYQPAHRAT